MLLLEVTPNPTARGLSTKPKHRLLLSSIPQGCMILVWETCTNCVATLMSRAVGSLVCHLPSTLLQATILLSEFLLPTLIPMMIASSNSFLTSFQSLANTLFIFWVFIRHTPPLTVKLRSVRIARFILPNSSQCHTVFSLQSTTRLMKWPLSRTRDLLRAMFAIGNTAEQNKTQFFIVTSK